MYFCKIFCFSKNKNKNPLKSFPTTMLCLNNKMKCEDYISKCIVLHVSVSVSVLQKKKKNVEKTTHM